jgi:hypothetical protein
MSEIFLVRIGSDYYNFVHLIRVVVKGEKATLYFVGDKSVTVNIEDWNILKSNLDVRIIVENSHRSPPAQSF